jgi:hypothetical protein
MAKGQKTGGRIKGTPNKIPRSIREAILASFDRVGGEDYLARQSEENPVAYMSLLGKVLPMQITGEGGGSVQVEVVKRVIVDARNSNG